MSQRTSKLLRKIADLSGRPDTYIKKEYKKMSPVMQRQYIAYMKENIIRIKALRKEPTRDSIIIDQSIGKEA